MRRSRIAAVIIGILAVILTGCSAMRFIATGEEFKKICEENDLTVVDTREAFADRNYGKKLLDSYMVHAEDDSFSVQYMRFSDHKLADAYYQEIADVMEGTEEKGTNYKTKLQEDGDLCRRVLTEDGRVLYVEGDKDTLDDLIAKLTAGFASGASTPSEALDKGEDILEGQEAAPASDSQGTDAGK